MSRQSNMRTMARLIDLSIAGVYTDLDPSKVGKLIKNLPVDERESLQSLKAEDINQEPCDSSADERVFRYFPNVIKRPRT